MNSNYILIDISPDLKDLMRSMTTRRHRRRNRAVRAHSEVTVDAVDVHLALPKIPMILANPKELLSQQRSIPFGALPILLLLETQTTPRLHFQQNHEKRTCKNLANRMNLLHNNVWITRICEGLPFFLFFGWRRDQTKSTDQEQKLRMRRWFWNL